MELQFAEFAFLRAYTVTNVYGAPHSVSIAVAHSDIERLQCAMRECAVGFEPSVSTPTVIDADTLRHGEAQVTLTQSTAIVQVPGYIRMASAFAVYITFVDEQALADAVAMLDIVRDMA